MANRSVGPTDSDATARLDTLLTHFSLEASTFYAGVCRSYEFTSDKPGALLHLGRGGRVVARHNSVDEVFAPTSLLFYPRPVDHTYRVHAEDSAEVICVRIMFRGGEDSPFAQCLPGIVALQIDENSAIGRTVAVMFAELDSAASWSSASLDRLSEVLIIQLLRQKIEEGTDLTGLLAGLADENLGHALQQIHDDPGRKWTVQLLADHALLSRTSFATEFNQTIGQTPMAYVNRHRIELAMRMLESPESVSTIADRLGFSSQSAFSRSFTKLIGVSPTQWRRNGPESRL